MSHLERTFLYEPLAEKVESLIEKQLFGEAITLYKEVLKLEPNNVDAWVDLGNVYNSQDQPKKSKECYERALALDPNSARATHNLGMYYRHSNKFKKALSLFLKALELKPDWHITLNSLGNLYDELKEFDKAEQYFVKAIEIVPEAIIPRYNLGKTYIRQERWEEAVKTFEEIFRYITFDSKYLKDFHFNLAEAYYQNNQTSYAIGTYLRLIVLDPKSEYFRWRVACLYEKRYEYTRAIHYYETMLDINPEREDTWEKLIHCCVNGGKDEYLINLLELKAILYAKKGLEYFPENSYLAFHCGRLLYERNRFEEALPYAKKAFKLFPECPEYMGIYGLCVYHLQGIKKALPILMEFSEAIDNTFNSGFSSELYKIADILTQENQPDLALKLKNKAKSLEDEYQSRVSTEGKKEED